MEDNTFFITPTNNNTTTEKEGKEKNNADLDKKISLVNSEINSLYLDPNYDYEKVSQFKH